jgi:membrane protease YdiL (CAAX protease family)
MSPRLDLPIAVLAWVVGFAWVGRAGSWLPLAALAVLAASRLVACDAGTRQLLRPRPAALVLGAGGGAVMVALTYALYWPMSAALPALPPATRALYDVLNAVGYRPVALAGLVLAVSACEEVVWRGRPLAAAAAAAGSRRLTWTAVGRVAVLAVLYGSAHLASGSLLLACLAAGCGLAWGLLRVTGRSLWPAIVTHAAWDLAILVAWPLT